MNSSTVFPPPTTAPCTISICGKKDILRVLSEQKFDGVISIIDPGRHKLWFPHRVNSMRKQMARYCEKILQMQFWDTNDENEVAGPRQHHVEAIHDFSKDMNGKKIAIHCMFGISRSPAAAIIVLSALGYPSDVAIEHVLRLQPLARPNLLMLKIDEKLKNEKLSQDAGK